MSFSLLALLLSSGVAFAEGIVVKDPIVLPHLFRDPNPNANPNAEPANRNTNPEPGTRNPEPSR